MKHIPILALILLALGALVVALCMQGCKTVDQVIDAVHDTSTTTSTTTTTTQPPAPASTWTCPAGYTEDLGPMVLARAGTGKTWPCYASGYIESINGKPNYGALADRAIAGAVAMYCDKWGIDDRHESYKRLAVYVKTVGTCPSDEVVALYPDNSVHAFPQITYVIWVYEHGYRIHGGIYQGKGEGQVCHEDATKGNLCVGTYYIASENHPEQLSIAGNHYAEYNGMPINLRD